MEPQIEKADHTIILTYHICCIVDYYPESDSLMQLNFSNNKIEKEFRVKHTVGKWKIKNLK